MQIADPQSEANQLAVNDKRLNRLLLIYLLIRVIGVNAFAWLVPRSFWNEWFWLIEVSLYGVIALMIRSEASRLSDFHIDKTSLFIFVIFGTVLRASRQRGITPTLVLEFALFFLISIWLIVSLRRRQGFPARALPTAWGWLAVALFVLLSWAFLVRLNLIVEASESPADGLQTGYPLVYLIVAFTRGMGYAAMLEEPVFRGFLMGYWRKAGLNPRVILIGQAAVFMLAHIRSIENPLFFWIGLPLGGLVFGWLAWKSRSVVASMIVHASYNALVSIS